MTHTVPLFAQSFIAGFILAMPTGPVSIVCIRKSLTDRLFVGIAAGMGAALADSLFAFLAIVGLSGFLSTIFSYTRLLRTIGGLLLIGIGVKTWQESAIPHIRGQTGQSIISSFATGLFLALSNPLVIIAFAAFFTSYGTNLLDISEKTPNIVALGVFSGSLAWFSSLSIIAAAFKNYCSVNFLHTMTAISGIILIFFGIATLASLIAL